MRLFYHPESCSYFLEEPGDWQQEADGALCMDVSDLDEHRSMAVLEGIDLDEITPLAEAEEDDFWHVPGLGHNNGPALDEPISTGGLAGAIAASMAKWARKPADLYPTPVDCTYSLLPWIAKLLPPEAYVLEPACADGQMVRPLEEFGYNVTGYDLRPDVKGGEGGIDFLDAANFPKPIVPFDAVITNPPFKAAELFIRRSLEVAPVVVMLLKAQFWNTANRKKLFRETKPLMELNLTWRPAFLEAERGKNPLMDCMWVVWQRGHTGDCSVHMIDRILECPTNWAAFDTGGL